MRAREADALAAFGGIIGLNRPIDEDTAPRDRVDLHRSRDRAGVDDERRAILAAKANMRVVVGDFASLAAQTRRALRREFRSVLGALLVQERDRGHRGARTWPADDMRRW